MTSPTFDDLVIRASAGSGKTFRLSNHYLALLAAGVPPSQVWAATFTRKSAGEILDRIVTRLAAAAESETKAHELCLQVGLSTRSKAEFTQLLREVLSELHRLRIGTLDSLFLAIATAFPLELGLPPSWGIADEADVGIGQEDALDAVLSGDADRIEQLSLLYERLSPSAAKRAVRSDLLERVGSLYSAYLSVPLDGWQTVPPNPPNGSIDSLLQEIETFDLQASAQLDKARQADLVRYRSRDWEAFQSKGLANAVSNNGGVFAKKSIPSALVGLYQQLLAFAAYSVNSDMAVETAAAHDFLDQFHKRLVARREANGCLWFDDVSRALMIGLKPTEVGFDYRIDGRVSHLLLDEFQDTSNLQWQVLKPLALRAMSTDGSVFGVGDVKQAIYGWRGGHAELLDRLPEELGGVKVEEMDHSRRSSLAVIGCINKVFESLIDVVVDEPAKTAAGVWQSRFRTHTTERERIEGYVHLETGPAQEEDESTADRRGRHYAWVAGKVAVLLKSKPSATIGVLCRKNPTVGRMIFELRKLGIPASEEGGNPITDSPAVEVILSLLTLADHPGDSLAAFHLANEPFATILRDRTYDPAKPLVIAHRVRTALMQDGYGSVVAGWAEPLKARCSRSDCDRLAQLVEMADAYQPLATLRPADFVARVRASKVATPTASMVRVLTLHKAKGLEFDAVVLPELDIGLVDRHYPAFVTADPNPPLLPHGFVGRRVNAKLRPLATELAIAQTEIAARRSVEESVSLLYVALTRSREALYAYPPGPLSKSHPDTWDTVMLKTLCGATPSSITDRAEKTVVYQAGDPNWEPEKPTAAPVAGTVSGQIRFRVSDPAKRRVEWVAPSRQEGGRRVQAAYLFANADPVGRRVGTLHHAWFAAIEWLDSGEPTEEQLRGIARRLPYEGTDLEEQIVGFLTVLRRPVVQKVLSQDTYPGLMRVERERSFVVRDGNFMVSGRLDRLVWLRNDVGAISVEVVDYKTDAISMAEVPKRVEHYRPQIEAYLRAVVTLGGLPANCVSGALVFTAADHIERVNLPIKHQEANMLDLQLRDEFKGKRLKGTTVDFTNTSKTGALDVSASDFLKITYPSFDLLKTIDETAPGKSRPVVLLGARGQGKSHLLAALYHLCTDSQAGNKWLADWSMLLCRPEIASLKLRSECCVIAESLHLHRYKFLWDVLFERHPSGKFFEGKWQGLGDKKTDVPSDLILIEMFQKQPAFVILDEFQTWFEGLTNTKQYPYRNWAFNFIQILSEIAQRHPELLTLVVSVRDGNSDAYQQVHRVNPVMVDFQGPMAKRDRQRLLLHRIFENRLQVPNPKIVALLHHHVGEYFRLAKVPQPEQERRQEEFVEAWPYAPHLLKLLDDQVLIAADAQETRDLIKILVDLYKQVGEGMPVITAADFSLTNEKSGVASLLDSVANELHKDLRAKALKNLDLLREAVPDAAQSLPHLDEIMSALWLRSLTLDKVAGAEPADLQIDITRSKPLDDNMFEAELATIEESSFNIHRVGTRLVFKHDENLRTKLLAHAKNDKLFLNGEDVDHLAKEIRAVISGPEHVSQGFRVVVLRRKWHNDPWSEFEEKDQPKAWPADGKLPMVVVPEYPDRVDATLGTWLKSHLQEGRNTIRFLLPAKGTDNIYHDKELRVLARAVYLAMQWKKDETAYADLQRKFQSELTAKLKVRFDHFAVLDIWNFAEPAKCQFAERAHGAQGDKIPEAVDKIIKQDVFIPEEFEDYVLMLADNSESVGKLLKDLREPRTGGKPCIPWLGELEIKERVVKMCAAGQIAINLRGLDMLQAKPGESTEDAWGRMKGKIGSGRHLDETTLHRPGAAVHSGGVAPAALGQVGVAPLIGGAPLAQGNPAVVNAAGGNVSGAPVAGGSVPNLFDAPVSPPAAKKLLSAPPTSGLNLLGQVESWGIGAATPLTNIGLRISKMTGAQLQQLLKTLPDGVTYGLEAEKDA